MVVLMEYSPCLPLKRKGAEEPGLFLCPRGDGDPDGFPLACRATKIRRLERADGHHDAVPAPPPGVMVGDDVTMGEAPSMVVPRDDGAMVVHGKADGAAPGSIGLLGQWRLRPWDTLPAGAEWIRDMLREAHSRTVRQILATGAQEEGDGMALVPWGAAPSTATSSTAAATVDGEDFSERSTAIMDVEEDSGLMAQTVASPGAGCGEGYFCRWPQHGLSPPQLAAIAQASPVMWSW